MSIKQTILTVIFLTIILPAAAQDHDCYNVEELCSEQREGYSCTLVRFNAHDGDSISAYILMPDNASQDNPLPDIYPLLQSCLPPCHAWTVPESERSAFRKEGTAAENLSRSLSQSSSKTSCNVP